MSFVEISADKTERVALHCDLHSKEVLLEGILMMILADIKGRNGRNMNSVMKKAMRQVSMTALLIVTMSRKMKNEVRRTVSLLTSYIIGQSTF